MPERHGTVEVIREPGGTYAVGCFRHDGHGNGGCWDPIDGPFVSIHDERASALAAARQHRRAHDAERAEEHPDGTGLREVRPDQHCPTCRCGA